MNPNAQTPDYFARGLCGLCPRCGKASAFTGLLSFRDACPACGFDLSAHDNGDGPAFFVIIVVGALVSGLAVWVEMAYAPPLWVHAVLWMPLILILTLGMLRLFKGLLLASQFKHALMGHDNNTD